VHIALAVWLGLAGGAVASPGDDDEEARTADAPSPPAPARPAAAKPVAFDRDWLEPFFKKGAAKAAVDHFRGEEWDDAEKGFSRALKSLAKKSSERQAATYMLALTRENQSDWVGAGRLFEDLYTSYPRLQPHHAYHAARCRLRRGDAAGALDWAAKVARGTVPEAEAELVRVDALRALGRWEDVLAVVDGYLGRFPNGPRHAEAMFRKAEAMEKTSPRGSADARPANPDATAIYRRVWAEAPLEAWGDRAAERLNEVAAALPANEAAIVRTRTAGEMVSRAMALFERNRSVESENAFAAALGAPGLDADLECRARFHRAQSVWKQRKQRGRAAPLFDEAEAACARAGNRDLHAKALYQGARCQSATGNREGAMSRFARVEAEHADHSYADDARIRSAEVAADAGDEPLAAKILAKVPVRYPKADLLNEALWRLAFGSWRGSRYEEALKWLDENQRLVPHEEIWYAEGRVPYWKGRVLEKLGRGDEAGAWYERAVRQYPLSVYALLALNRMAVTHPRIQAELVAKLRKGLHDVPAWKFPPRPLYAEPGFLRAVELARMGQGSDARRELGRVGLATTADKHASGAIRSEDEELVWITSILLDRGGVWNASHSLPRYGLTSYRLEYPKGLGEAKWRLAYPRAFPALIEKNTKANQLPEAIELAIIREESAFSPRIESYANAIGLTQMLVSTAKRYANGSPVNRDVLMDPAKNVELGARFLGFLWKHFGAAAPLAIAGYNAGEAAVDRWLGERGDLAMDEFMETIPYDETRNYTKRVLASYFTYSWLYGKKPVPVLPLEARGKVKSSTPGDGGDGRKSEKSRAGRGRASHR